MVLGRAARSSLAGDFARGSPEDLIAGAGSARYTPALPSARALRTISARLLMALSSHFVLDTCRRPDSGNVIVE